MRATSVNLFILDILDHNHSHLTAQEVYEQVRERLPAVNPSTVYRALERLAHAGKISVSDMGTSAAVFESIHNGLHHHLVCQGCGHILTLDDSHVRGFLSQIENDYNYQIVTNHLVLFGLCPACKEQTVKEE